MEEEAETCWRNTYQLKRERLVWTLSPPSPSNEVNLNKARESLTFFSKRHARGLLDYYCDLHLYNQRGCFAFTVYWTTGSLSKSLKLGFAWSWQEDL